jgi:hypothetical protein
MRSFIVWLLWLCVGLGVGVGQSAQGDARPEQGRPAQPDFIQRGPRVKLGYHLYTLHDRIGGGIVHAAAFSGFLPTRYIRAGGGIEAGARSYAFGHADGLLTGNLFVGYQHMRDLGPVMPYLVAVGELGLVIEKRYHTSLLQGLRGCGFELGADVKLVRSLHAGVGLTFMLYTLDDLAYDTFGLRLSIGL